jgi:hypothetical protein
MIKFPPIIIDITETIRVKITPDSYTHIYYPITMIILIKHKPIIIIPFIRNSNNYYCFNYDYHYSKWDYFDLNLLIQKNIIVKNNGYGYLTNNILLQLI